MPRVVLACLLALIARPALADDTPRSFVRGEIGAASVHWDVPPELRDPSSTPLWVSARLGRVYLEGGTLAVDGGVAWGGYDSGFTTVTGGLELRAPEGRRVRPFGRLEAGYLNEAGGGCPVFGFGAGVTVDVARSLAVRVAGMANVHCIEGKGPAGVSVGIEYRW